MSDLDEKRLIAKLRAIEALYARPGSDGERVAAEHARERILDRLREIAADEPPVEYRFSMRDMWSRRVFVALLRRYDIRPYRYRGQRHTTVMAQVSRRFVDETLWPEFEALSATLRSYLDEVTDRVVSQVIHGDVSEANVVDEPSQLPLAVDPPAAATPPPEPPPRENAPTAGAQPPSSSPGKRKKRKKRKRR